MTTATARGGPRRASGAMANTRAGDANPWHALWAMMVGFFMILLDSTIVAVANQHQSRLGRFAHHVRHRANERAMVLVALGTHHAPHRQDNRRPCGHQLEICARQRDVKPRMTDFDRRQPQLHLPCMCSGGV